MYKNDLPQGVGPVLSAIPAINLIIMQGRGRGIAFKLLR